MQKTPGALVDGPQKGRIQPLECTSVPGVFLCLLYNRAAFSVNDFTGIF